MCIKSIKLIRRICRNLGNGLYLAMNGPELTLITGFQLKMAILLRCRGGAKLKKTFCIYITERFDFIRYS
jgi:hypothetical protein